MKKIILLQLTLLLALISCDIASSDIRLPLDDQVVELSLRTTFTTALSQEAGAEVAELDLLVCKDGVYQYRRSAYASEYARFRSSLQIDENINIYFFANCSALLDSFDFTEEVDLWEDIRQQLIITQTHTIQNNRTFLPMWGEIENVTISRDRVNTLEVTLLRAVASVNVYFDLESGAAFTPTIAYLYYGADRAFIAPEKELLEHQGGKITGVSAPGVPSGMQTTVKVESAPTSTLAFENTLFMFDNNTSETEGLEGNKRTRVVIGGKYNGAQETTYYALDLFDDNQQQGEEWLRATRNHRYSLTVTAVKSEGWKDQDTAAESANVNLEYEVVQWSDKEWEVGIDGPDYLSLSRKYIMVGKIGKSGQIGISGTFTKKELELSFAHTYNGEYSYRGEGKSCISNNRFKAEITGETTNLTLTVTALGDFSKTDSRANTDKLVIRAGRLEFKVDIDQVTTGWGDGGGNEIEL